MCVCVCVHVFLCMLHVVCSAVCVCVCQNMHMFACIFCVPLCSSVQHFQRLRAWALLIVSYLLLFFLLISNPVSKKTPAGLPTVSSPCRRPTTGGGSHHRHPVGPRPVHRLDGAEAGGEGAAPGRQPNRHAHS